MCRNSLRIILVHGFSHGAWCWYKIVAGLKSKGYSVTAIDMAASGADARTIPEDVSTFAEYSKPLMDLIAAAPSDEKLLLVGHSLGGLNISFAMEAFPEKVAAGVFITAVMPDTVQTPDYIIDLFTEKLGFKLKDSETKTVTVPGSCQELTITKFSEKTLAANLYQNSRFEDLTLAVLMVRFGSFFIDDLKNTAPLSKNGFGSVDKFYVVCQEDELLPKEFQHLIIQNYTVNSGVVNDVIEIKGADHMAMFSEPQKLCKVISSIADKYS